MRRIIFFVDQVTHMSNEMESMTNMSLVQVWLGLGMTCGCLISGMATITQSRSFLISTYCLVQLSIIGTGLILRMLTMLIILTMQDCVCAACT